MGTGRGVVVDKWGRKMLLGKEIYLNKRRRSDCQIENKSQCVLLSTHT